MTRVLLTGGNGFLAAHILELLLQRGHSVVATVRSKDKADKVKAAHPEAGDKLDFTIVDDVAREHAFDHAVKSDPPFQAVIHTASPYTFNVTDVQKQLLDPAIIGTTAILKSIKKYAPTVERVVITSSFASILNQTIGPAPGKTYSEADWNPITYEQALESPQSGYLGSKTFAEKAAWEFLEKESPKFTITTICPPMVYGPVVNYLNSLDNLNTSNQFTRDLIQGKLKDASDEPMKPVYVWVDVRDAATAHVNAMEQADAANKRFLTSAGNYTKGNVVEIIRKNFPEYDDKLPPVSWKGGDPPAGGVYDVDNARATKLIGGKWRSLETCTVDQVKSLKEVGA